MDRSYFMRVALFGSLREELNPETRESDNFITTSEPYCFRCGKFTPSKPWNGWEEPSLKLRDLESPDGDNCDVCRLILSSLRSYRDALWPDVPLPDTVSVKCIPGRSLYIDRAKEKKASASGIRINGVDPGPSNNAGSSKEEDPRLHDFFGSYGLEIFVTPEHFGKLKHVGVGRPVQPSLGDERCIALARQWISECQSKHPQCKLQSPTTVLPSRVVDVGSEDQEPRLVETRGATGRYAALSHCWGKSQPLTTTSATLSDRLKGISLDSLPKTFQEATLLARKLDLPYLWIDSLCIIQDSAQDWEAESARMGDVYRGAVVTIAAVSAEDGRQGCFVPKADTRRCEAVPVEIKGFDADNSSTIPAYIRRKAQGHDISNNRLFESEPLSGRAWVLQERILSTRVLMFTSTELVFECQTDLYCECGEFPFKISYSNLRAGDERVSAAWHGSSPNPGAFASWRSALIRGTLYFLTWLRRYSPYGISQLVNGALRLFCSLTLNRQSAHRLWRSLIAQYSRRCLTYDKDALPALSGLAGMMQDHGLNGYLAGIWRGDLHKQLLWSKLPSGFSLTKDEYDLLMSLPYNRVHQQVLPYRAKRTAELCPPSWSWASIRGAVWYGGKWLSDDDVLENLAEVVEAVCEPASRGMLLGSVSRGYLVLRAPSAPIRLGFYEENLDGLLTRCKVGEVACTNHEHQGNDEGASHQHDDGCVQWNREQWAILDLPLGRDTSTPLEEQDFWRVRIASKAPPHRDAEFRDYAGRWFLGSLASDVADTHTIHYHLLVRKSALPAEAGSFERVGLFVETVSADGVYEPGEMGAMRLV